jgi:hypothetical protein
MLLVGTVIAVRVLMSGKGTGLFQHCCPGRRHHHHGLIAVIHRRNAWIRHRRMPHRARQFDHGRDALHGQRRNQYP